MVSSNISPIFFGAVFFITAALRLAQGGICWSNMNGSGRCIEMLSQHVSKDECCQEFPGVATAWSPNDLESGALFFLRVLGGGVPCEACKESCQGVECGTGKKCAVRGGHPKCVCAPVCKEGRRSRGTVCGTDERSYRNVCRLRKRACRKRSSSLTVAYHGFCQRSCENIRCPKGKMCVIDQNLSPHCVKCSPVCEGSTSSSSVANRPVCGADGITYANTCVLRQTACHSGKAIPVAYKGRCKDLASCGSVRCRERQACLMDRRSGRPRCVTCATTTHCSRPNSQDYDGPICGSNNRTYPSWCHMIRDSCATGYVIDTASKGRCSTEVGVVSLSLNTVIDHEDDN